MTKTIPTITDYLLELDALKAVYRRTYVEGGERLENSAEHSWHLAIACWTFAHHFSLDLSEERLLKLALIHDLGEIDAGDTFLYSNMRDRAHEAEREGIKRLTAHPGNGITDLAELWEEQESGTSIETHLLKTVDRLLPFLLNISCEGKTWREAGIKRSQVLNANAFIKDDFPDIHAWVIENIEMAVARGWLLDT